MRAVLLLPMLLSFACASGSEDSTIPMTTPNWIGPAVSVRHEEDRSLHIEMMAPTAGHALSLLEVKRTGNRADVQLQHDLPTGDLVAQVLTPLPVDLAANQLEGATTVFVWVLSDGNPARLALATARP
tara:strand:- start:1067 stop:1450 length:384 start_codon:yes stop_codon:yes gene_type:complete